MFEKERRIGDILTCKVPSFVMAKKIVRVRCSPHTLKKFTSS
jgi:hypothetical protein